MKLRVFTVSEVNRYLYRLVDGDPILNALQVEGEISGFKRYPSGHIYFSIKDRDSKLQCVIFKSQAICLKEDYEEGCAVKVSGHLNVYEREGRYQLICNHIEKRGLGDLYVAFIKLKTQLKERGLFDITHKRPLPAIYRVGVISSAVGAAIEDFKSVLKRRNRLIEIVHYPCLVQGKQAAAAIIDGIDYFNKQTDVDAIVITRGGGSIEDLWCFNDVKLAEKIYHSDIVVVSAVGHEVDESIADYVSDLRAATPSAAAELISETLSDKVLYLQDVKNQMTRQITRRINYNRQWLDSLNTQRLQAHLSSLIKAKQQRANQSFYAMKHSVETCIRDKRQVTDALYTKMKYQSPQTVLAKGYALVSKDSQPVTRADDLTKADTVQLRFCDGQHTAVITGGSDE